MLFIFLLGGVLCLIVKDVNLKCFTSYSGRNDELKAKISELQDFIDEERRRYDSNRRFTHSVVSQYIYSSAQISFGPQRLRPPRHQIAPAMHNHTTES